MLFKLTFSYLEGQPEGGTFRTVSERIVVSVDKDEEIVDYISNFKKDDRYGYRKNIQLVNIQRV